MRVNKLSFVNIALAASLVLAFAAAWTALNHLNNNVMTFKAAEEIVVYDKAVNLTKSSSAVVAPAINSTQVPAPMVQPAVIYKVLPEYPASAVDSKIEGIVMLKVLVSVSGKPANIEIGSSSGSGLLDASALKAVSQWVFEPARRGAQAIESYFEVPVRFQIK